MTTAEFYRLVLELTGRTDRIRISGENPTPESKGEILGHLLGELKGNANFVSLQGESEQIAKWRLFCSVLSILGIKKVNLPFYKTFLGEVDYGNIGTFRDAVNRFRVLAMLEFGNFRYAYKMLREATSERLHEVSQKNFSPKATISEKQREFENRLPVRGLELIPPEQLFMLGYLAIEQLRDVNNSRKRMQNLIDQVRSAARDADFPGIFDWLKRKRKQAEWRELLGKIGVDEANRFHGPLFLEKTDQLEALAQLRKKLATYETDDIETAKKKGMRNTDIYLSASDLDIYVATSMRNISDFTSMSSFIHALTENDLLKGLNLRLFDPTQSYVRDRIQKGLLECLMVKRAKMTIYNAQEKDTFGKDSEASISLALGKPVLVYVARFFREQFHELYSALDDSREMDTQELAEHLFKEDQLSASVRTELRTPETTKARVIQRWAEHNICSQLDKLDADSIFHECHLHGYVPGSSTDENKIKEYALERIIAHEKRAMQFSQFHPLAMQTGINTGVACGLMVTRSVETTAKLIKRILLGGMCYSIDSKEDANTLLREELTGCPVRVVTSSDILTTAFWDSYLS